jgi:cell division protein FtsZ
MGIGGMGRNAMENIARSQIAGLELYSVNTDMQALNQCLGSQPVQIGAKITGGKGAGGDSEVGRLSAEEDVGKLRTLVEGAELVFIAAGMGGGTGTGAAPVIAKLCRELDILTIAIVTTPMNCEGRKRSEKAKQGLLELRGQVDSLVVIENEKLSLVMNDGAVSIIEVFRRADEVLLKGIVAIDGMINLHGYINLDLADLRNVLKRNSDEDCTDALIGVGVSAGEGRALLAAAQAMENPLLANGDIGGASKLLINVAGDANMGLNEAQNVVKAIVDQAGEGDREIFMGIVTDNSLGENINVTLIATGMGLHNYSSSPGSAGVDIMRAGRPLPGERSNEISAAVAMNEEATSHHHANDVYRQRSVNNENTDNFGSSPFVRSKDWQIPAYARRECRHGSSPQTVSPVVARDHKADFKEVGNFKRSRRKSNRIFGEPDLRMAC